MSLAILVIPLVSRSRRSASISCEEESKTTKTPMTATTTVSTQYVFVEHEFCANGLRILPVLSRLPEAAQAAGRFVR